MNNAQEKLVNEIVKAHEAAADAARAAAEAQLPWGERDAWAKLAEEKDASGAPVFPSAAANVKYWTEMVEFIDAVGEKIDGVNAILKGE